LEGEKRFWKGSLISF